MNYNVEEFQRNVTKALGDQRATHLANGVRRPARQPLEEVFILLLCGAETMEEEAEEEAEEDCRNGKGRLQRCSWTEQLLLSARRCL
jgi:hypothetical protein